MFLDVPELEDRHKERVNQTRIWSIYYNRFMSLYFYKGTYTKLNLVRDSFGRKGNHSK